MIDRLCLGTVQFGLDYGIANRSGRPSEEKVRAIVEHALENGLRCFDTAQAYGDSEARLGRALSELGASKDVQVITKLAPGLPERGDLLTSIEKSLERLRVERLEALMLHNPADLKFWDDGLGEAIGHLQIAKKIGAFGVSVYHPEEVERGRDFGAVAFQVPLNAVDRRFADFAAEAGEDFYVRSIFLQGLMQMSDAAIRERLPIAEPYVNELRRFCVRNAVDIDDFVLGYAVRSLPNAVFVFGVDEPEQIEYNVRKFQGAATAVSESLCAEWNETASVPPEDVWNPSRWPANR